MPRHTPYDPWRPGNARPARRAPHARLALLAAATACAVLLAAPATAPRGEVLDLVRGPVGPGTASGSEPGPSAVAPMKDGSQVTIPGPMARLGADPGAAPVDTSVPGPMGASFPMAPPIASLTGYQWPIAHPRLTLPFGPTAWGTRLVDGESFHDGVDLATFCGDRIVSAHDGTVLAAGRHYDAFMGWVGDYGPYLRRIDAKQLWLGLPIVVVIDDGNGYRSVYAHFGRVVVRPGQHVHAGKLLGYEGATGHASGCHLHYGLFSTLEPLMFGIRPDVVKRMHTPKFEIARIDPLLVLPPRRGINAPATTAATSP